MLKKLKTIKKEQKVNGLMKKIRGVKENERNNKREWEK